MLFCLLFVNVSLVSRLTRLKANPCLPRHHAVQLTMKIGKSGTFGNLFFIKYRQRNSLKMNALQFWFVFAHIQDSWEG
jgi:hypothetical protein